MTTNSECAAFEAVLADYLDGTLADDGGARAHIVSCESCRALLRDMERIRSRAASLPTLQPSRDLWAGIEARIQSMPQDATPGYLGRGWGAGGGSPGSGWSEVIQLARTIWMAFRCLLV